MKNIKNTIKEETGCLEFVSYYENKVAEIMDPFRRCRAGSFSGEALLPYARETYLDSLHAKESNSKDYEEILSSKVLKLINMTNELLEKYFAGTKKEIAICPDLNAYLKEIKDDLNGLINKKVIKN